MTAPWMLEGVGNTAQSSRLASSAGFAHAASAIGARSGIVPSAAGTELRVTANGTPNKSVNIAPGQAVIQGTSSVSEGAYVYTLPAATTATIDDGYASNARVDLIAVRIHPGVQGGAAGAYGIVVVKGADTTGSPVPAFPSDGASYLELARLTVPSLATRATTVVQAGDIGVTGRRFTSAVGGTILCTSTTRPASPSPDTVIKESDTGRRYEWNATTSAWRRLVTEDEVGTGEISSVSNPAAVTVALAADADLGVASPSLTFKANQRYILRCHGSWLGNAGITNALAYFARVSDSVAVGFPGSGRMTFTQGTDRVFFQSEYEPGAADVTMAVKVRVQPFGGTITTVIGNLKLDIIHDGLA